MGNQTSTSGRSAVNQEVRLNSLGMAGARLSELLDSLDTNQDANLAKKRAFVRWPFRTESLHLSLKQPGGTNSAVKVAGRNLSSGGMSVLHRSFLHLGTQCVVKLPQTWGGTRDVDGVVARCRHVAGVVHEIGIRFSHQIEVRDFIESKEQSYLFTRESVTPEAVTGAIMHVDDSALDRTIVQRFLKDTSVSLTGVNTVADALNRATPQLDLIITDFQLSDGTAPELISGLRQKGVLSPVLLLTADTSKSIAEQARTAGVIAILSKPLAKEELVRVVAEFLITSEEDADAGSAPGGDEILREQFLTELKAAAGKLEEALTADNAARCKMICLQLKGTAAGFGFQRVADQAARVLQLVDQTQNVADNIKPVQELIALCNRVRG
ncbi:MAG: response regulator [Planctomycetota bacterium]|nr:response regulator [Planctomycetota bacterium]